MKNRIYAGKCSDGREFLSLDKIVKIEDGLIVINSWEYRKDIYNLNLKNGEIVEIIIDTETQKYVVKRLREIGWYLTVNPGAEVNFAAARHWNGETWKLRPREKLHCSDGDVAVVSEIIRDNEYLKSLE